MEDRHAHENRHAPGFTRQISCEDRRLRPQPRRRLRACPGQRPQLQTWRSDQLLHQSHTEKGCRLRSSEASQRIRPGESRRKHRLLRGEARRSRKEVQRSHHSCISAKTGEPRVLAAIMMPQLRDSQVTTEHAIHDSVLTGDATRPVALKCMLQWLRLTDAAVWLTRDVFDELVDPIKCFWVRCVPVEIIFPRVVREDEVHTSSFNFLRRPFPRSSCSIDCSNRLAFAGDRKRCAVSSSDSYSASDSITTA